MDKRRRNAALAGAGAAIAASAPLLARHGDDGYFAAGLAFGIALGILILAAFGLKRGASCPDG